MKTLYLDIFSGISGDMFIGALLDLGVPVERLEKEIAKLGLDEYHVHVARAQKASITGVKFDVHAHAHEGEHHHHDPADHSPAEHHPHAHPGDHQHDEEHGHSHEHPHEHAHGRTFHEIRDLIEKSDLSPWTRSKAIAVFSRIARAEGKIHGQPPEEVHFHEVGAIDSIVDIVGACAGLELLGKPRVLASPVVDGTGFIDCAHGRFPVPAPATLEILTERGVPITQCDEPNELVTPTGAAILAEFASEFGPLEGFVAEKIGYGLGQRDNRTRPNVLRALLGSGTARADHDWETDTIAVLETNIDDISSEVLGYVVDKAFAMGALDAFHTAIQMKKNRPGVLLTVLCTTADQDRFTEMVLRETSALGVRRSTGDRRKLKREVVEVITDLGKVEVKLGKLDGKVIQTSPEFESCRKLAEEHQLPLKEVYQRALAAADARFRP